MSREDQTYYRQRARSEWCASRDASSVEVARIHQRLALNYEERLCAGYSGLLAPAGHL